MSMQNNQNDWIALEIWADTNHQVPYILMLLHKKDGSFAVIDPKENYKVVFSHSSYEEVQYWLGEDEFSRLGITHIRGEDE